MQADVNVSCFSGGKGRFKESRMKEVGRGCWTQEVSKCANMESMCILVAL